MRPVPLLLVLLAGCGTGTAEEIAGEGAPAACNELRAAFCGKGFECIENFDEGACRAELPIDGTDCEDAALVRADIDGCAAALRATSCAEAVEGTVIAFVPPCDEISVE